MKQRILCLLLLASIAIGVKAQTFIGMDDAWILDSSPASVCDAMKKRGLKMGEFTYGYYFYKNTGIKLISGNGGNKAPAFLNPESNAILSAIFIKNGKCVKIMNCCKSKTTAQKWINELKRCGYKSTGTKSESDKKVWYYHNSTYNKTYELIYFTITGEYGLTLQ